MKIVVSKDIVKIENNHSENHYGEYNVNECTFQFDDYFNNVSVKRAIFTSRIDNKSIEVDVINDKCMVPSEILKNVYDEVTLGVYGYELSGEELLVRYSPTPDKFVVHDGSYKENAEHPEIITPSQYDIYSQALQEGLARVDDKLVDVEKQGDYANTQGDYAKEQGDYAKEQGTNAKNVADDTQKKAEEGKFNGKSLEFIWQGTKLGVRLEGQEEYQFVDLQGVQGEIGATGEPFKIKKTYASVSEMNADFRNMVFGDYVMIASSVEVEDNAKLYTRGESAWIFISDFSGAMGIRGETGLTPNIKIGEVKTLEAGSQAKVTRSGSNEEPVFNFELPKGDKGDDYVLTEEDKVEIGEKVNTEYEKRIAENEKDIIDIESYLDSLTPKNSASGELVHITDALGLPTFETKTSGNVEQETTKGQQLFDYEDITKQVANEFITDDEGWITLSCDNSAGTEAKFFNYFTNNLALENSKNYNVIVEVKKVTGEGRLSVTNTHKDSQFNYEYPLEFIGLKNGSVFSKIVPTKDSFEGTLYGLRTYISFSVGRSGSITFRISVLEDTTVTPETFVYEPYTGGQASPNPSYPQEIEVLEGYNLFNPNITNFNNKNVSSFEKKGIENGSVGGDAYKLYSTNTRAVAYINLSKIDTYTISSKYMIVQLCEIDENGTITKILSPYTFTNTKNTIGIVFKKDNSNTAFTDSEYDDLKNSIQLVEGTSPKPYLPYGCIGYKGCRKNLLSQNNAEFTLFKKLEINPIGPGTYKISGKIISTDTDADKCLLSFRKADVEIKGLYVLRGNFSETLILPGEIDTVNLYASSGYNISVGDTATYTDLMISKDGGEYEPYQEQIVPLDLKGNEVVKGDNIVIDKKGNVSLVKNWVKADLTDTNVGKVITEYNGNYWVHVGKPTNSKMYNSFSRYKLLVNCAFYSENNKERFSYQTGIGSQFWGIIVNSTDTIEDIRPKLLGGYYYYELAEPQIIELGELPEPIKTFEGVNNIQVLANLDTEIEVKYALDIKKYTDNKLAEISAQII